MGRVLTPGGVLQHKFPLLGLIGLTAVAAIQQAFFPDTSPWIVGALAACWLVAAMALTGMSLSGYKLIALAWFGAACGFAIGYGVYGWPSKVWPCLGAVIALLA